MSDTIRNDDSLPEELRCGCGEAMKFTTDRRFAPIGCTICGSEIHFETVQDFEKVANKLREYWLARGRSDYAGVEGA